MDPKDLVKVWDAPDHSRLTPKQISIRLPILVAAKISALCEMYPRSSKSKVIGDLLATALDEVEKELPSKKGRLVYDVPLPPPEMVIGSDVYTESERAYEDVGLKGRFRTLTEKYLRELEKEAGIKEPLEIPKPWVFEGE
jgi:hypothetical protein